MRPRVIVVLQKFLYQIVEVLLAKDQQQDSEVILKLLFSHVLKEFNLGDRFKHMRGCLCYPDG